MGRKKHDQEQRAASAPNDESGSGKRARARRLLLKSIVTGGAAVTTARSLPERWTRPITESVLLPAHAQVSQVSVACRVETLDATVDPPSNSGTLIFDPAPPPVTGGSSTTVENFLNDSDPSNIISIALGGVSATVDPAAAGDVTLTLTPGGDFSIDSNPGPIDVTPNGSGVANFGPVLGDLGPGTAPADESVGNLELRFSAAGVNCIINFTFLEIDYVTPP